ncbi:MAG: tRNA epoxyqueuosine(34) reductase QueG [Candidatus Marinimicrobia bacterium]|nr:tRNA epoxyqueuosine(34) reductase QueG [Candidatus Neomarinimicrobiota bacterium]
MNISSNRIKKWILEAGFQTVGIAQVTHLPEAQHQLKKWLSKGNNGTMNWMKKREKERGDLNQYFPEAKSVVSVGLNYFSGTSQKDLSSGFKFSNYAWGDDYHGVMKSKLFKVLGKIKEQDPDVNGLVCVDTSPVMEKVWAQEAGLGWQGKHTNLITRDYGSWIFLGEIILDIELETDQSFDEDLCGTCTACINACPTQALGEYEIDSRKCISYLTIEHRGEFEEEDGKKLNDWIYGCDICQEVCPWNEKFGKKTDESAFYPRKEILDWTSEKWNALDEEGFRKLFRNSAVKRTKFSGLKRNITSNNRKKVKEKIS